MIGDLLSGITSFFGDGFDLLQKGAQVYSALSGDDDDEKRQSQGFMQPDFRGFRTSAARARPMEMESPYGMRAALYPENVQVAMRSMAQRQLSDNTLQQVRDTAAVRRSGRIPASPNVMQGYDMGVNVGSARASSRSRARFRSAIT